MTADMGGEIHIWDVAQGTLQREWDIFGGRYGDDVLTPVRIAAWSPDGKRLLASGPDTIQIWDPFSGREELRLPLHADAPSGNTVLIYDVQWSADGTRIATLSGDGFLRVWDATTGT